MTDTLLDLLHPAAELPTDVRKLSLDEQFGIWRERHGDVVEFVTRRALAAARNGAKRLSAKAMVEEARMSSLVTTKGRSDFKVDNSMTALLARYLVQKHPELEGLFEFRARRVA